ncbi:hypothetical protein GE061_016970 [Apolygus lucorum]|uniref:Uncharacterized protein n=1 Tax=Apolygus lucorum TaxID=248454 RepID=A0A8S9XHP1_APOLU|nr:hypothetical protein GE061_016970 [Apolygus lucorum]
MGSGSGAPSSSPKSAPRSTSLSRREIPLKGRRDSLSRMETALMTAICILTFAHPATTDWGLPHCQRGLGISKNMKALNSKKGGFVKYGDDHVHDFCALLSSLK